MLSSAKFTLRLQRSLAVAAVQGRSPLQGYRLQSPSPVSCPLAGLRCLTTSNCVVAKDSQLVLPDDSGVKTWYKKFFRRVPQSKLRACGVQMLSHCVDQTDLTSFISAFDMPDSFYSWFLVTELHVWMLTVRLMAEDSDECRAVRNSMVETLWADCDGRAKMIGEIASKERRRQLCDLSEEFQAALLIYDDGLIGDDKALANAVWRRFFLSAEPPDAEKIELMVAYIRRTISVLDHIDLNSLVMTNALRWLPLHDQK